MGIFGRSKASILAEAFYKCALDGNKLDELASVEAGAKTKDVLRESDFSVAKKDARNKKEITDFDSYTFNYVCYLPGRLIWIVEHLDGENLSNLFDDSELKDIDEKNAVKALESKWKKLTADPDLIFPGYSPSFIYYKKIDVCRYMEKEKREVVQIRVGDFQFILNHQVLENNQIKNTRGNLLDRDDQRFLQLQIAESNLR